MRDIYVGLPCYSGEVAVQTLLSLLISIEELREQGWRIKASNVQVRVSDADIGQARNCFLGGFLASDCSDLLFIDADVSWQPGTISQLFRHNVDFVAGAYRLKKDDEAYPILWPEKRNMYVDPATGLPLIEIAGIGCGFMRLSRAGVQKIFDAAEVKFPDKVNANVECPWVFEFAFENGRRKSEDYIFCKRWREIVGPCWVDPTINVDHTGKKTYLGDVMGYLRRQTEAEIAALPPEEGMAAHLAMMGVRK